MSLEDEGKRLIQEFDKGLSEEDEQITDPQDPSDKELAKARWARLEAIIGNPNRLKNLANDIVTHFEQRQSVNDSKEMIVAMSRRIAAAIHISIIPIIEMIKRRLFNFPMILKPSYFGQNSRQAHPIHGHNICAITLVRRRVTINFGSPSSLNCKKLLIYLNVI